MIMFNSVVRNLSTKERILLLRRIKNQHIKVRLLNFIVESDTDTDNHEIGRHLDYNKNSNSIYTLKNRLLDDIMAVKQEFMRNEVIRVKEQVQSLFPLLMNADNDMLLRELRKLEKTVNRYELYPELREIHTCYYYLHMGDPRMQEKISRHIETATHKAEIRFEADRLFFGRLIHAQELFYYKDSRLFGELRSEREKLNQCSLMLQSKTLRFYLEFTDSVLNLVEMRSADQAAVALKHLQNLNRLGQHNLIKRTIPLAQMAIDSLYLRYHLLTAEESHFSALQRNLYPGIRVLRDHYLLNSSFVVYVYHSVGDYVQRSRFKQAAAFIDKLLDEDSLQKAPAKYRTHLNYFLALKEYYLGNYATSGSLLVKTRSGSKSGHTAWTLMEITLLNLLNMIRQQEFLYIGHEVSLLRKYFSRYRVKETHRKVLNHLLHVVKSFDPTIDHDRLRAAIDRVKEETGLMNLARFV